MNTLAKALKKNLKNATYSFLRSLSKIVKEYQFRKEPGKRQIAYFPKFSETHDLTNHFYRAAWYLPSTADLPISVQIAARRGVSPDERPGWFTDEYLSTKHIDVISSFPSIRLLMNLFSCDVILIWKNIKYPRYIRIILNALNKSVNVDTDDMESREFGAYPSLIWCKLLARDERDAFIRSNHERFREVCENIKKKKFKNAVVCGNGPSLDESMNFDLSESFVVACNTVIKNKSLFNHLNPSVITGSDSVSHIGISQYAGRYRQNLLLTLSEKKDIVYICLAKFAHVILAHYPQLRDRAIFIDQGHEGPNFNLLEDFRSPNLDSTMNIHMLPVAATLFRQIFLIGCDGKAQSGENEDFWSHSRNAQYHDLVHTGHKCHPTFDRHRQKNTYAKYLDSITSTITQGRERGITYISLAHSHVPVIDELYSPCAGLIPTETPN